MNRNQKIKNTVPYIAMTAPAVLLFLIFFVIPLFFTIRYSFYNWTNYSPDITFSGLSNYVKIPEDKMLKTSIKNSLLFATATVVIQSVITMPIAVVLNSKLRGRNIFRAIFFMPVVMSTLVVGYLWKYLLSSSDYGFVNQIITGLGFEKINFFGNGNVAMWTIILVEVWQWFGWAMVIYLGNLQNISGDLFEAASVDGANAWDRFWHIIVPGLAPAIKINVVTGMINGLKVFDIIVATTNGGPAHRTETILTSMYSKFSDGNFGYASAYGTVFLVVAMIVACILLGGFKKWEERLGQ